MRIYYTNYSNIMFVYYLLACTVSSFILTPASGFCVSKNVKVGNNNNKNYRQSKTTSGLKAVSNLNSSKLTVLKMAGKRRSKRRRKDGTITGNNSQPPTGNSLNINAEEERGDELPEFDLDDESFDRIIDSSSTSSTFSSSIGPTLTKERSNPTIDSEDPFVIEAMKATNLDSSMSAKSTRDLLRSRDRELEKKFVLNEISQDVPSLGEYTSGTETQNDGTSGKKRGKKAARAAARREAAILAETEAKTEKSTFLKLTSNLPFVTDEEDKSPIKLLEEGTWACIFILVAWEIYLNSPLFDRAAPMAPVVYTSLSIFELQ
mmetsp:Transcript_4225/g.5877  ORF Transcript_4225/g.5877 Transcript_4225/m.5877 type:complete len:319 (-) Transcript_4225:168-1124(-)